MIKVLVTREGRPTSGFFPETSHDFKVFLIEIIKNLLNACRLLDVHKEHTANTFVMENARIKNPVCMCGQVLYQGYPLLPAHHAPTNHNRFAFCAI